MRPSPTLASTDRARRAVLAAARLGLVWGVGLVGLIGSARAVCDDPDLPRDTGPAAEADCDEDGWTPAMGDCDDFDPMVNPGMTEICGDRIDNNCDGFIDEGCDRSWERGTLQGGAGCAGGTPIEVSLLVLLTVARRRRSC